MVSDLVLSPFDLVLSVDGLALELELELGVELELGLALEPDAALPLVLPELAPPLAGLLLESIEPDAEPEAEPDGAVDGDDGEVVAPDEDEDEPDGEVVLPDGAVVAPRFAPGLSPARSQPVTSAVPRARETAIAIAENLMWPPWVGVRNTGSKDRAC